MKPSVSTQLNYNAQSFLCDMIEPAAPRIREKIEEATGLIRLLRGAVVALSAGVDSSLVALLAQKALGKSAVAVTGVSESLPPEELEIAKETARLIGIRHVTIQTDELRNPNYFSNPANRCYYCKETLYAELRSLADGLGFESILDGTHVDDLGDDRPGLKAAQEAGVISPLLLASFSKADVRESARMLGLPVWDKPAMPCLSSRIPHGEEITIQKLSQVGEAELIVKRLSGARDIRVRHHGTVAAIEVSREELPQFHQDGLMNQIERELRRLGFTTVTIGPRNPNKVGTIGLGQDHSLPIINTSNH